MKPQPNPFTGWVHRDLNLLGEFHVENSADNLGLILHSQWIRSNLTFTYNKGCQQILTVPISIGRKPQIFFFFFSHTKDHIHTDCRNRAGLK